MEEDLSTYSILFTIIWMAAELFFWEPPADTTIKCIQMGQYETCHDYEILEPKPKPPLFVHVSSWLAPQSHESHRSNPQDKMDV